MVLALYAVKVRAEAMQEASKLVPSGMLSVIGRPQAQYKYACLQAKEHCRSVGVQEPVCSVASYLFPDGRVIAGHQQVRSVHGRAPKFCIFFFFQYRFHQSCVVFPGSELPPAELAATTVLEDQTCAGQRCFPHQADGVGCWAPQRRAQAGGGQSAMISCWKPICCFSWISLFNVYGLLAKTTFCLSVCKMLSEPQDGF